MVGSITNIERNIERVRNANNKLLGEAVMQAMPQYIRLLNEVPKYTGEIGSNLINAAGTGIIAPLFIAYNPLADTDKDTKIYSAWRQPISAVLAILMQFSIVYPFSQYVQKLSNEGLLAKHLNRTLIHEEKYLKQILQRQYPNMSAKEIAERAKNWQTQEYAEAMELIQRKGILSSTMNPMSVENFKTLMSSTTSGMLEEINNEITYLEKEKPEKYFARMKFYRDNPAEVRSLFNEISDGVKLDSTNDASKQFFKDLLRKHKDAKPEIIGIIKELSSASTTGLKRHYLSRLQERFKDAARLTDDALIGEYIKEGITKHLKHAKDDKTILEAMTEMVSKTTNANYNRNTAEILEKSEKLLGRGRDFLFELVQKEAKNINNRFKSYKDVSGLMVGFLTLPVTCYILNWIYPRFMEKFFPSITAKKPPKTNVMDKFSPENLVKNKLLTPNVTTKGGTAPCLPA